MDKIEIINSYYIPEVKERDIEFDSNNFSPCYNSQEFIKNLAIKILENKHFILFKPALRCGKTPFYTNLLNEIKNQIKLRELKHPLK